MAKGVERVDLQATLEKYAAEIEAKKIPEPSERAKILTQFLSVGKLDTVHVTSVIPMANYGPFYSVALYKTGDDGSVTYYQTDSAAVRMLSLSLDLMSKKKRKKYKNVIKGLKAIDATAHDPVLWNKPFNTRSDH